MFNYICPDGQRASGGTSIMVKSSVPHSQFDLKTNLQAVAVNVTLSKKVTICSIYLPPSDTLSKNSLVNLIDQLPHPFMLVGDFNGHSKVWGCSDTNDRGKIIEDVIVENDLCLLNEKQPTYLHPPTGNYYAIDLSLCHPNIYLDFDRSVDNDLHGSDHFPILIKDTLSSDDEQHCRWNLKKANWETFTTLCQEQLTPEQFKKAEDMSAFTSALHDISEKCILKSSTRSKRRNPWYNDDCKTAINKRKSALQNFNKNPSCENHMHSKLARAKARRTIKDAKRSSWRQYVKKLNSRTPVEKVWGMIRKVSGKNKKSERVHIKSSNGNMCYSTKDISNALGGNFQKNSSSSNYSQQFQDIKMEKERENLNFQSQNSEKYSLLFKLSELKNSLDKSHDTTAGPTIFIIKF